MMFFAGTKAAQHPLLAPSWATWHLPRMGYDTAVAVAAVLTAACVTLPPVVGVAPPLGLLSRALAFAAAAWGLAHIALVYGISFWAAPRVTTSELRAIAEAQQESTPPVRAQDADADVVVVGAGIAGISAALSMARAGRKVTVVERDLTYQDRIVGELLQPGGCEALAAMGLGHCLEGAETGSVPVEGYAVYSMKGDVGEQQGANQSTAASATHDEIMLRYPATAPCDPHSYFGIDQSYNVETEARALAALGKGAPPPIRGRSFHHGAVVQRLRVEALDHPNVTLLEGTVTDMVRDQGGKGATVHGIRYRPRLQPTPEADIRRIPPAEARRRRHLGGADAADAHTTDASSDDHCSADSNGGGASLELGEPREVTATLTLLCDGIWSALRRKASDGKPPPSSSHSIGILLRHPPNQPPVPRPNHGHVILARPCPLLLYQISETETRALAFYQGKLPSASDGSLQRYLREEVAPQLPAVSQKAFVEAVERERPKCMPNRAFPQSGLSVRHAVLVGDSNNMRHPLTGGGMTVALRDVHMLTSLLTGVPDLRDTEALHKAVDAFRAARVQHAATVNVLANALFAVFSTPGGDPVREDLRAACYDYLAAGGARTAGPMGLLSGITPVPIVLVAHFFAVAFHAIRRSLAPFPTPSRLLRAHRLMRTACAIILPLLRAESATIGASPVVQGAARLLFPPPASVQVY